MILRRGALVFLVCAMASAGSAAEEDPLAPWRPPAVRDWVVRSLRCETSGVFEHRSNQKLLFRAADALHANTRRQVVLREVLLREGARYDAALAAESERNIRALGFIAAAELIPEFHEDGTVDVLVRTRDKFSFRVNVTGALVGGVSKGKGSVGEENLMGLGKKLEYSVVRHDDGFARKKVEFEDKQLLDSRWVLDAEAVESDLGRGGKLGVGKPFRSRLDDWAWAFQSEDRREDREYFDGGAVVYREPLRNAAGSASLLRAWGPRDARKRIGLTGRWSDLDFAQGRGRGTRPATLASSLDSTRAEALASAGLDTFDRYHKRTNLDSLDFIQDVPEGVAMSAAAGLGWGRNESRPWERLYPVDADLFAVALRGAHIVSARLHAQAHVLGGEAQDYAFAGFVHHYWQPPDAPWRTLAWSLALDLAFDDHNGQDRFTLGEDSGLRGYSAREFSGNHRLRINVEERIRTPWTAGGLRVGAVFFADSGLAWGPGRAFRPGDLRSAVGLGLRIGSSEWFRESVFRVDVAIPIDGADRGSFSVSAVKGQVFDIFENFEHLSER